MPHLRRRSRVFVQHALTSLTSSHPYAAPLRALSWAAAAVLLAALVQVHRLPEFLATVALAASLLGLLILATATAVGWLLLGLPATTQLPFGLQWLTGFQFAQRVTDPAIAFKRLRYLSLRRCTLAEHLRPTANRGLVFGGWLAGLGSVWAAAAQAAAAVREQQSAGAAAAAAAAAADNGDGGSALMAEGGAHAHRRRACETVGAALLHWLLPRACAAAELCLTAVVALLGRTSRLPPLRLLLRWSRGPGGAAASGLLQLPRLAVLLSSCPELRFVDLTYISGGGSGPADLAKLAHVLRRTGGVHYLAVAQPAWLPLSDVRAEVDALFSAGGLEFGSRDSSPQDDRSGRLAAAETPEGTATGCLDLIDDDSKQERSEHADSVAGARPRFFDPVALLRWAVRVGHGTSTFAARAQPPMVATPSRPLLIESGGLDDIIARELIF